MEGMTHFSSAYIVEGDLLGDPCARASAVCLSGSARFESSLGLGLGDTLFLAPKIEKN